MSPLIYKKQNKNQKWRKLETMFVCGLYHTTCMHSADYGVVRCMSVRLSFCLSVCLSHAGILSKRLYISSKFFSPSGSPTILVVWHRTGWQYSDADLLTGASNARGMKKSRFSTNISLYLGIDARYSHSYYGRRIGNRTQTFEWYQSEWTWVTSNPDSRSGYYSTLNN